MATLFADCMRFLIDHRLYPDLFGKLRLLHGDGREDPFDLLICMLRRKLGLNRSNRPTHAGPLSTNRIGSSASIGYPYGSGYKDVVGVAR